MNHKNITSKISSSVSKEHHSMMILRMVLCLTIGEGGRDPPPTDLIRVAFDHFAFKILFLNFLLLGIIPSKKYKHLISCSFSYQCFLLILKEKTIVLSALHIKKIQLVCWDLDFIWILPF